MKRVYFVHCYNEARRQSWADVDRHRLEAQLEEIDRQLARAVAAIIQGRITDDEADQHLPALRRERERIAGDLAMLGAPPKVVSLRPSAVDEYVRGIDRLHEVINADLAAGFSQAATVIRGLIETVTVMPTPPGRPPGLKVQGSLDSLVRLAPFQEGSHLGGAGGAGCPLWSGPPETRAVVHSAPWDSVGRVERILLPSSPCSL
jgi:hypothetical protein